MPTNLWDYYLKSPELWDFDDIDEDGLQRGVSAILIAPHTVTPYWVEKESATRFTELKMKMTAVVQVLEEIKRFADEDMPEDNQLAAERKEAQKCQLRPGEESASDLHWRLFPFHIGR